MEMELSHLFCLIDYINKIQLRFFFTISWRSFVFDP